MNKPMRIADKIEATEARLVEIKDQTAALMKAVEEDDRDLLDEEQAELDELSIEAEAAQKNLAGYKRAELIMATKAASVRRGIRSPLRTRPGEDGSQRRPADQVGRHEPDVLLHEGLPR